MSVDYFQKKSTNTFGHIRFEHGDTSLIGWERNDAFEEIFLLFNYQSIVNTTITANYNGGFFLPITEIFDQLLIVYDIDRQRDIIEGYFIDPENKYKINFNELTFSSSDTAFVFSIKDFIKKDFEYFLCTDFIFKAFHIAFSVDLSNLALSLTSKDILPVHAKYLREQKYNYLAMNDAADEFPMLFPREKFLLRGGFLDYALSSSFSKHNKAFYNYYLGFGIELLGGDLQTLTYGYSIADKIINSETEYRWRYALDKNQFLSNISIGSIISAGLSSYLINGIQISNQPLQQRDAFVKFLISDQTTPGSTIELYINDQLEDHTSTDAAGNFHFWIPLAYGSSFIKFKYFGPDGETKIIDRYYQIPYSLNPPRIFNYTIDLGKIRNTNKKYFHASGIYGVNDWLSNIFGTEYLEDILFKKPIFYNSLTARVSSNYLFNLLVAPSAYYRVSANAVYPSLTSINFSFTRYETNSLYNPTNIQNEIAASLHLPFYVDENPLNIQLNGSYQEYPASKLYDIRANASKNFGSFTPALMYSLRRSEVENSVFSQAYLSPGIIYSFGSLPSPLNFLHSFLTGSGLNYNLTSDKFESFFLSIASNLSNSIRLQFDYEKNLTFNVTNARVQMFLELPFTRSYSSIGKDYFTTNLQGSLLFNDVNANVSFFNREQIGRASTSFRMFLDENMNGAFDGDEQLISNSKIKISSLGSNIRFSNGETGVNDLNPFTAYDVKIDEISFENPLSKARNESFSFEAAPNYVTNIDIPFYNSSEISGSIVRVSDNGKFPLNGIKVYVEGIDNDQNIILKTFSDGTFYHFGLRPGKFKIYLDKNHLEYLNSVSEPAERILEIGYSEAGGSLDNLNFELRIK